MRRMICVVLLALGLVAGTAGTAHASNSCPSGSRYQRNAAGGVCIGLAGEGVVKTIVNGRV